MILTNFRENVRQIVATDGKHRLSRPFDQLVTLSVLVAIIHLTLETEQSIYDEYKFWFIITERILTIIFSVEYILRVVSFKRSFYNKSCWL